MVFSAYFANLIKGLSMKKETIKSTQSTQELSSEGILGMMISLHTFPIESEEDLEEKRKLVKELSTLKETTTKPK